MFTVTEDTKRLTQLSYNAMSKKKNRTKEKKSSKKNGNLLIQIVTIAVVIGFLAVVIIPNFFDGSPKSSGKEDESPYNTFDFKKEGELTFASPDGGFKQKIDIEIAEDNNERATGLMYRHRMLETQGMLFIFPVETIQSFWMRNTQLSLDMFFVNKSNEIVTIHRNTEPFSEQSYVSTAPAVYVIEVVAGFADKHNIEEGDHIVWRRN